MPTRDRKDRGSAGRTPSGVLLRTFSHRVRRGPGAIAAALAVVGFAMGFAGYGQLDPDSSVLDRLYSSLQLLVLAGPTGLGTGSLPLLLNLGRFVAAAGLAGTVLTFFHRLGTQRVNERRARRARGHVLVIGSSEEARRIAEVRSNSTPASAKVFLLGDLDEGDSAALRDRGVRVVSDVGEAAFARVIDGAAEVIVAENDDGATDSMLRRVLNSLGTGEPTGRLKVRVLVRQTDLARTLREEFANSPGLPVSATSLSVVEAASQQLSGESWLPPLPPGRGLHLVVIGEGELAKETAISVVERRIGRTYSAVVGLWPVGDAAWCEAVKARVGGPQVDVQVTRGSGSAVALARAVADTCKASDLDHQVYVIGLEDGHGVTVARRLRLLAPDARVAVVHQDQGTWLERSLDPVRSIRSTSIAELLSGPEMWDIDEQLGREILLVVRTLARLPGASGKLGALPALAAMSGEDQLEWAMAVSSSIRTAIATAGFRVEPTEQASEPPVLMTEALLAMQTSLKDLVGVGDPCQAVVDLPLLLSVLQDLPEMLRRSGYSLVSRFDGASESGFTVSNIDRLAARAHQSYCDIALKLDGQTDVRRWAELGPDEVESNRAQIRDIPIKLLRLGYRVVPASTPGSVLPELTVEDVEALAWYEHLRWMHSRVINGWEYGAERDNRRRLHPLIVAYEDLPEHQWEFDRGPVRLLPELLQMADLAVIPIGD